MEWEENEKIVNLFLTHGADINAKDDAGQTVLFEAFSGGEKDEVEFLLAKGAHINAKDHQGRTALLDAVDWGNIDLIKLMPDKQAVLTVRDINGTTPRALAVGYGDRYEELAKLLRNWERTHKTISNQSLHQ